MSKLVRVTAQCVDYYETVVEVPDGISEEQVMAYFRHHGANGEFEIVESDWTWGDAEEVTSAGDASPAYRLDLEPEA